MSKQQRSHDAPHDHGSGGDGHKDHIKIYRQRFWISLALTLPILIMAPLIQDLIGFEWRFPGDRYVQFIVSSFIFFYGGWPFLKGLTGEIRRKAPGMMTLIGLAISVAYLYSSAVVFGLEGKIFFWELASLIDVMLLGHWIEMRSIMGASNALEELAELMPSNARKINENGETEDVPVSTLKEDDLIMVRAGEKIPADGVIAEGKSHVNESMLTGESRPVAKNKDDKVIAGSVNDNGVLKIRVRHTGKDSYLSKVINMVGEAQKSKSKTQNFADKAAGWLFYIALSAGIVTLAVWLGFGRDFQYSLERMVTVMIISCPHALGLAVPLVVAISTSVSAKEGLLIRNRTAFENARKLSVMIFDKTGTLTKGEFGVTRFQSTNDELSDEELLRIAASVEKNSEHPIAGGIVDKAGELDLKLSDVKNVTNITGEGIEGDLEGNKIRIAGPGYLAKNGLDAPSDNEGNGSETLVFVLSGDKVIGYIALADEIRKVSHEAVKILKERNIKVMMATGDNEETAKAVSEILELDGYYSEILPEDKKSIIRDLQNKGEFVGMTGDGVNDAPALAQADIGIAVGSGTDVAAETADIILVNSNPKDIVKIILFGTATYKKIIQNLFWAAGYNIVAIPLAAGVLVWAGILLSPAVGALLMSMSTVIVALNAQLLRKKIR